MPSKHAVASYKAPLFRSRINSTAYCGSVVDLNTRHIAVKFQSYVTAALLACCALCQRGMKISGLWPTGFDNPFPGNENVRASQGTVLETPKGEIGETVEDLRLSASAHSLNSTVIDLSQYSCQLKFGRIGRR